MVGSLVFQIMGYGAKIANDWYTAKQMMIFSLFSMPCHFFLLTLWHQNNLSLHVTDSMQEYQRHEEFPGRYFVA
jgi:hypothetical protein